jgi:hypothetical protein
MAHCLAWSRFVVCRPVVCLTKKRLRDSAGLSALAAREEEFGVDRLSDLIRRGSSMSAEELSYNIFQSAKDFCQGVGFNDDATVLIVKCNFDGASSISPPSR